MKLPFISSKLFLLVACFLGISGALRAESYTYPRPPQYVLLAFDGSSSISMWEATRQFAKDATAKGHPLKFTYFISGVYYVGKSHKNDLISGTATPVYLAPQHGAASAIGWGDNSADLLARSDETNLAHQEGNEIGSHAVGHWDGTSWSYQGWSSEFSQFTTILSRFYDINQIKPTAKFPSGWLFSTASIVGFRAPLLGVNSSLYQVLKDNHFRYDTSKTAATNYWPKKAVVEEPWNFPLAGLRIAGTGKRTLSMDYNFYYADSAALPNPAGKTTYKKQMLDTYLQFFQSNYNGNRAPINIGHHFSQWNGGAYWEAMQDFATQVCGMPEVRCVTYRELANYMDSLEPRQIKDYQDGNFEKAGVPVRLSSAEPGFELDVAMVRALRVPNAMSNGDKIRLAITGSGANHAEGAKIIFSANGTALPSDGNELYLASLRRKFAGSEVRITASVIAPNGLEIARATQTLERTGLNDESLSTEIEENRAMLGDLPEAHVDESIK